MKIQFEWEDIFQDKKGSSFTAVARAKVQGGWIIKNIDSIDDNLSTSLAFVPDDKLKYYWSTENEIEQTDFMTNGSRETENYLNNYDKTDMK